MVTAALSRGLFDGSEIPPPHHLSDWGAWSWAILMPLTFVLFAVAALALYMFAAAAQPSRYGEIDWISVGFAAAALVMTLAGVIVHGNVARHIAGTAPDRLWLAFPLLVAAAYAGITAQVLSGSQRSWLGWGMTGTVLLGGVGSAINDALNRVAANIPMGLKALVTLLVLGAVVLFAFGMSQGSSARR